MRSPIPRAMAALLFVLTAGCSGSDDPASPLADASARGGAGGAAGSSASAGGASGATAAGGAAGSSGAGDAGGAGSAGAAGAAGGSCPPERSSSAVSVDNELGTLSGTLVLPAGCGPFASVLFIAGSGPTDRDGNQASLKTDCYKQLAEGLADRGIASVRYDKRGIGKSIKAAPASESDYLFEMGSDDAARWVSWMRQDSRLKSVSIIGHSEGSLLGMLAAKKGKLDGFVSLAGAGRKIGDVLRDQLAGKLPQDLEQKALAILAQLEAGKQVSDVPSDLMPLFRPSVQPYMISWLKYDPAQEIAALGAPTLIVQGETDIQVSVAKDAKALAAARPDATLLLIKQMNHVLKQATIQADSQNKAYTDPTVPLAAGLVDGLDAFFKALP